MTKRSFWCEVGGNIFLIVGGILIGAPLWRQYFRDKMNRKYSNKSMCPIGSRAMGSPKCAPGCIRAIQKHEQPSFMSMCLPWYERQNS